MQRSASPVDSMRRVRNGGLSSGAPGVAHWARFAGSLEPESGIAHLAHARRVIYPNGFLDATGFVHPRNE
jgi:hypothetical protein